MPRIGQPLATICVVTLVRSTFSSCSLTQPEIRSLSVTSTVEVRLVISRAGSMTRSAYSPNTRSVTTSPVRGSCTSSTRPPKRKPVYSRVPTKYSSAR